ncbi:FAD binding domain-containing protein [Amycolatopsis anabasis]|uniref:FAD binding domain-containing protein n=1 Tax=Amycolatopsis anabasis TaxID=1840409 RepID=UPI00131E8422|nr:xanthine dehydrogenase family protein subunit M [Amycolatopsis anabasis]
MRTFSFDRVTAVEEALSALREPRTQLIAGGTELVNWLKEGIEAPDRIVDITRVPLHGLESGPEVLRLGALARMSDVAADPDVRRDYPVLAESLLRAASAQLRNMATLGGNLMQRTRCPYFRAGTELPCNKRTPDSGCSALHGDTSTHAIFGWSEQCVATHPSDLAVALSALEAEVVARSERGERRIPAAEFHHLPGENPARHNELLPDELITAIEIPARPAPGSHYLKVRERVSYEFAVVSAAAVVRLDGGAIAEARIALGGVAHRPWRLREAEAALPGLDLADADGLRAAIDPAFADARPLPGNEYKVTLGQRAALRALRIAGERA